MADRDDAMINFHEALVEKGLRGFNEVLIARDIPGEYKRLLCRPLAQENFVLIYETREDVRDLCREEEKRLEKIFGSPRRIDDEKVAAIFIWNQMFGIIQDVPIPVETWVRRFGTKEEGQCVVCLENTKSGMTCSNCISMLCFECHNKLESSKCPVCTIPLITYSR